MELSDSLAGQLLSGALALGYVYWMVWVVLLPFVDSDHALRALYPSPDALAPHTTMPELVIPVAGVQVLIAVVSSYIVARALADSDEASDALPANYPPHQPATTSARSSRKVT